MIPAFMILIPFLIEIDVYVSRTLAERKFYFMKLCGPAALRPCLSLLYAWAVVPRAK
jgi:hypothetical protein